MASEIEIARVGINTSSLIKSASDIKKEMADIKKEQKDLQKAIADGQEGAGEAFIENEIKLKSLSRAYSENMKAISAHTQSVQDAEQKEKLLTLAMDGEIKSVNEARGNIAVLTRLRNDQNTETKEGQAEILRLNKAIDANNDYIKENADELLKLKMNIGNYSDSVKDALANINPLNGGLSGFISRAQDAGGAGNLLKTSLMSVTTGIYSMVTASLAFLATPIGAILGVIGLALGAVVSYLKNTQSGIDAVTAVTKPLSAVLQVLGTLVNKVGKALFEAFSNPKKTLEDLANFVKQNLINRFTAFAKILDGILSLDFGKISDGVLQAGTGVENLTGKIKGTAQAVGDMVSNAVKVGQEIDRLNKQIERGQLAFQKNQLAINDLIDEQRLISKDSSRPFAERAKASEEIIRLTGVLGAQEEEIIKKKIRALQLEYSLKDAKELTIDEQQKMIDLEKALDDAQDRSLDARLEQSKVLSGMKKEEQAKAEEAHKAELARQQKLLDDAVAKSQANLALLLSQQGIKTKSMEDELILAQKVADGKLKIAQDEYNASKKTEVDKIKLQTDSNNAKNELLKAQTEAIINESDRQLENARAIVDRELAEKKYLNDETLKLNQQKLDALQVQELNNAQTKLEQGAINQVAYNDELDRINEEYRVKREENENIAKEAQIQKKLIDIENEKVARADQFNADLELQAQENAIKMEQELAQAEENGANVDLIKAKYAQMEMERENAVQMNKLELASTVVGALTGIAKDQSAVGKALAVFQIGIDTQMAIVKALASAPPPYNYILAGAVGLKGAMSLGKVLGAKFEKGGLQEVGGKRHIAGGTKFFGEDGTTFEAEKGELIGVMNRNASKNFMAINDGFSGSGASSGLLTSGSIISQGVRSGGTDTALIIATTVEAIKAMPAPIVTVEDINYKSNQVATVASMADLS